MVKGTCCKSRAFFLRVLAFLGFVEEGVIFWFFPPVTVAAVHAPGASIRVIQHNPTAVPVRTHLLLNEVVLRFSAVVLPVVRIHTHRPIMFDMVYAAERSLEVEHKKILVILHVVK